MTLAIERPASAVDVEALYRERRAGLVGYATKHGPNRDAAEDAVQEAFETVLREPERARNPAAFVTATAKYRALNESVHRSRHTPVGDAMDWQPDKTTSGDPGDEDEGWSPCMADPQVAAEVHAALAQLSEFERSVITLHILENLPVSVVSERLGADRKAIYAAASRGLARLRHLGAPPAAPADPASAAKPAPRSRKRPVTRLKSKSPAGHKPSTAAVRKRKPSILARAALLRTTYGVTPPADLPGTSELGRAHGWDRSTASYVRSAYLEGLDLESPGMTAKVELKQATAAAVRTTAVATVANAPAPEASEAATAPQPAVVSEAWLSWADALVTCMFVHADETTARHPTTFRSMPGAQREVTGLLMERGYRPDGPWTTTPGVGDDESMRRFKPTSVQEATS